MTTPIHTYATGKSHVHFYWILNELQVFEAFSYINEIILTMLSLVLFVCEV